MVDTLHKNKKLKEKQSKIIERFMLSIKIIFFLCIYKMVDINVETWNHAKDFVIKYRKMTM